MSTSSFFQSSNGKRHCECYAVTDLWLKGQVSVKKIKKKLDRSISHTFRLCSKNEVPSTNYISYKRNKTLLFNQKIQFQVTFSFSEISEDNKRSNQRYQTIVRN